MVLNFNIALLLVFIVPVQSGLSLLGIRSNSVQNPGSTSEPVQASFSLDTSNKDITRLHGKSIKFDVNSLEVETMGGLLRLSDTHAHFEKGGSVWKSTVEEDSAGYYHNNRGFLYLDVNKEFLERSRLRFSGEAVVEDLWLGDKSRMHQTLTHLCKADRTFSPLPVGIIDLEENMAAIEKCEADMTTTQLSLGSMQEYVGKLLLTAASIRARDSAALRDVQALAANISSTLSSNRDGAEEKERVRAIMTEFEAVVDALRLEITGKVKALHSSVDALQGEWLKIDTKFDTVEVNLTTRLSGAVGPLQEGLRALGTAVAESQVALNATLEARLNESCALQISQMKFLNGSLSVVQADLASIADTSLNATATLNSTLGSVMADIAGMDRRLSESIVTLASETRQSTEQLNGEQGAKLAELSANVSEVSYAVRAQANQQETVEVALRNVSVLASQHSVTLQELDVRLVDEGMSLRTLVNNSAAAVQSALQMEIALAKQEATAALATASDDHSADISDVKNSLATFRMEVMTNLSDASTASAARGDQLMAGLREELHSLINDTERHHHNLSTALLDTAQELRFELKDVTDALRETSSAAIAELTTNTSNVVARSNSILAKAIGEVNSTLLNVNRTLAAEMRELHGVAMSHATQLVTSAVEGSREQLRLALATTQQDLLMATALLNSSALEMNATLLHSVAAVETGLRREVESLSAQNQLDVNSARQSIVKVNGTLTTLIAAVQDSMAQGHAQLNSSTSSSLSALRGDLTDMKASLSGSIQAAAGKSAADLEAGLKAAALMHSETLVQTVADLTDLVDSKTDKLRYSLVALNASIVAQRAEDQIAQSTLVTGLEKENQGTRAALDAAVVALQSEASVASQAAHKHTEKINASLSIALSQMAQQQHASAESISLALETLQKKTTAQIAAEADRTTEGLHRSSILLGQLNTSVTSDLAVARTEAKRAWEKLGSEAAAALEQEAGRWQRSLEQRAQAVTSSADASLSVAVASLRDRIDSAVAAVTLQAATNFTALSAGLSKTNNDIAAHKASTEQLLQKISTETQASMLALDAGTAKSALELRMAIGAVNSSVAVGLASAGADLAVQTTTLRGIVAAVNASALTATSALAQRIDGVDAAMAALSQSNNARADSLSQRMDQEVAASSSSLSSQWARTEHLVGDLSSQVLRNISSAKASMVEALDSRSALQKHAFEQASASWSHELGAAQKEHSRMLEQVKVSLTKDIGALNQSTLMALAAGADQVETLSREMRAGLQNQSAVSSATALNLTKASDGITELRAAFGHQTEAIRSTLANHTEHQNTQHAQLMATVEARAAEVEIQQRLGAVAVDAVRNDTMRLSSNVVVALDRVSVLEGSESYLRAQVQDLQARNSELQQSQSNMTSTVLPSLFTQLGALQQGANTLRSEVQRDQESAGSANVKLAQDLVRLDGVVSQLQQGSADVQNRLTSVSNTATEADARMQQLYIDVAVRCNSTAEKVASLGDALRTVSEDARLVHIHKPAIEDAQRRLDEQDRRTSVLTETVAQNKDSGDKAAQAVADVVEAQGLRLRALESAMAQQQAEITRLQEENRRLLRETSTVESTDELRKLLFDLQGQMLAHSSKVLDLLLQPRSAVLVQPPSSSCAPSGAANTSEGNVASS